VCLFTAVVLNLFLMATHFLAIYFWWHPNMTKCLNVCVLKWQICVFFYKMKSLDCLATHFDVTRDTQKCRNTLFENHCHRLRICKLTLNIESLKKMTFTSSIFSVFQFQHWNWIEFNVWDSIKWKITQFL